MDLNYSSMAIGAYAGLVSLGLSRGVVRFTSLPLLDLLKLTLLAVATATLCCDLVAAVIVAIAAFCLYNYLPSPLLPTEGKAVFITGCDTGLGHLLAIHLDKLGVKVFAGCLFPGGEGEHTLKAKCSQRLCTVPLDVCSVEMVKSAADRVKRELGGQELWGVVNNAGVMHIGCLEVMGQSDIDQILDVNYKGQVNVIRAFLPFLRRSRGRLVNVASNTGIAPVPYHAVYCASKAAVATLTESLRLELQPFGVSVSTIIPSGYRTGIQRHNTQTTGDRWWAQANQEVRDSYGQDSFTPQNKTKDYKNYLNADFSGIIHKMADALLEKCPQDFYYKGLLATSLPFLYLHTPSPIARLFYPALATWYKFDPPGASKRD